MSDGLEQIVEDLSRRLGAWVPQLDGEASRLQALQESVDAHADLLGATARRELSSALRGARENVLAVRRRMAAEAIAKACREHLIRLDPGRPLQRKPRKNSLPKKPDSAPRAELPRDGVRQPEGEGVSW